MGKNKLKLPGGRRGDKMAARKRDSHFQEAASKDPGQNLDLNPGPTLSLGKLPVVPEPQFPQFEN